MSAESQFEGSMKKIEQLIGALEHSADPATRSAAKELVAALMEVHGGCLARMIDTLKGSGESGETAIRKFQSDPLVRNILILYDLHSAGLKERVDEAIEKFQRSHQSNGVKVELLRVEDGVVQVRYTTESKGCGTGGVKATIESLLVEAVPDAVGIYVEDAKGAGDSSFVPLSVLAGTPTALVSNELQPSTEQG